MGERGPGQVFPNQRTPDIQMFPLLHLHGETAHLEISDAARNAQTVPSLAEYYRYRIAIRNPEDFNIVHHPKKLFSLFLLNGPLRVIYDWLTFRALNQNTLKAENYTTLRSFVQQAERQNRRVGRIVILPKGPSNLQVKNMFGFSVSEIFGMCKPIIQIQTLLIWFLTFLLLKHNFRHVSVFKGNLKVI